MSADLGTIYYQIDAKTDGLLSQSRAADRAIADTEKTISSTEKAAADLQKGFGKLADSSQDLAKSSKDAADPLAEIVDTLLAGTESSDALNSSLSVLSQAIRAVIAASALREIAQMVQGYQEMEDRVRMATSSTAEFEAVQARLVVTANGTYRSLSEAQELYIRTADSLRSMGYSTSEALDVTDSMSYAFVTNAASADKASSAIDAFSKILSKGKVEADAWETIVAATPTVIKAIADATGKTEAEIRTLGATGKLTAAQLTEGLRKALDATALAAAGMSNNLVDAATRMRTALTAVFVEVERQTGAWQALTDGIIMAADWILDASGDTEKMGSAISVTTLAIGSMAAIIAGRMLTAMGAYIGSQAMLLVGFVRQNIAERAAATLALANAQAQLASALSTAQRTAALTAQAAAQARLNAVMGAGAIAARGLGMAMALLGGPGGLILLAALAIGTFAKSAADAKAPIDNLAEAVGTLGTRALELQKIQLMDKIQQMGDLGGAASNSAAQIETLEKNLKEFPKSAKADDWRRTLVEQRAAAEAAGTELGKYQERVKEVEKELSNRAKGLAPSTGDPALVTPPDTSKEDAAAKKRQAELDANLQVIKNLTQANREAALSEYALAEAQALSQLNDKATDEQIAKVKELTRAIYDKAELVKRAAEEEKAAAALQTAATAADPRMAAADKYKTDLEQYKLFKENQLITDLQYEELKNAAATQYEAQRLAAQEQMFASQSRGNAFVMDSINALGQSSTQVLSGLLSGTMSGEDAMKSMANTIFNQVIGAIVQMGIDQVKSIVMGQAAQAVATGAGVAQAATLATAYAPAAAAASVASFGSAAVAGLSAMAAAVPAMMGLVGGRKAGGPVNGAGMYRVNEGGAPEIFTGSNGSQYLLPNKNGQVTSNKDATSGGALPPIVNINNYGSTPATVESRFSQADNRYIIDVVAGDMMSGGKTGRATNSITGTPRAGT